VLHLRSIEHLMFPERMTRARDVSGLQQSWTVQFAARSVQAQPRGMRFQHF
jgi:hypothetical protein